MIQSKLIQLLQTFSTEEWRLFNEFVASPFFNKKKDLISFCTYLKQLAPNFPPKKTQKNKIYKAVFPNKQYDEKHLSYLMNYLLELAEQFLGWKLMKEKKTVLGLNSLAALADRKLLKHYNQKYRKMIKLINDQQTQDDHFYLNQFMVSEIAAKEFEKRMVRTFNQHFQEGVDHLDHFYFLHKLKYSCEMIDRQQVLAVNYDLHFLEETKAYILQKENIPPDIEIYLNVIMMLTEENADPYFLQLKKSFQQNFNVFPRASRKDIYFYLINFCLRKIRKGEKKYVAEALDIYWDGIQNETLFEQGFLSPWTFTNVVKLALRLERYDWIQDFIWKNESKMEESFRENALYYNLSELYYYTKNYEKALEHLNQVKFSDLNYHLGSRVILIKIYFETNESHALTSLIASFTIFLKRNKNISNNLRQTYLNFCDLLNQILRKKATKSDDIKLKIQETPLLTDRQWLMDALENILTKKL